MLQHPELRRRVPLSRREFLRRATAAGIALPSMAAILAACGGLHGSSFREAMPAPRSCAPACAARQPRDPGHHRRQPTDRRRARPRGGPAEDLRLHRLHLEEDPEPLRRQHGRGVEYTVFDTPDEMVSKMQSNGSDFDLIVTVTLDNIGKLAPGA